MLQRRSRTPQTEKKSDAVSASGRPAVQCSPSQEHRCLRGCKPAIMWATGRVSVGPGHCAHGTSFLCF
ncbi:hypothetical protein CesoFtcFv8_001708 [Champsocephalus esox]|uniref:Uncharacterized protein n=2 Tax=Champsocephalus TaxID=52236 RepID=A0AAN8HY09_CHAGU|nr:hypothetical protein CesoFtcFv8_001708 [Champsocephalus esox]KAK5933259.1 hypothetical protein CgunFtcFv8_013754 [Champsocephalus gunnari]